MLPKRRKAPSSGILRAPRRDFPRHRKFVRSHECVVTLTVPGECEGDIECCHVRTAANAGVGIKPPDWETFPGCHKHHAEQHQIGQGAFETKYRLNLVTLAAEFAAKSPDTLMKEAMRNE